MGKRNKKEKLENSYTPTLEDIINLGGDKTDLELIKDLDEDIEALESKEDFESEPVKKDEIRDFIKGLEFWKVMQDDDQEGTKKKLLKAPKSQEEKLKEAEELDTKISKKKNKNKFKIQDDEISSTTDSPTPKSDLDEPTPTSSVNTEFISKYKPRKYPLVKLTGKWYEQFEDDPVASPVSVESLEKLREYTQKLFHDEVAAYRKQQEKKKSSESKWIETVLTSGTLGDKTAAYTLQIQESAVHHLNSLDRLVGMVKAKGKREALMVLDNLKELFVELLPDRKLRTFGQHPFTSIEALASRNNDLRDRRLLLWLFEEHLKERYQSFVQAVEKLLQDQLPALKMKALVTVYELLASKPEEEKSLLGMLVNKLGDLDNKVVAKSTTLLQKLVARHPNMKMVVVLEMERMLYRSNISDRAQYHVICFLNQTILSRSEEKLASKLITIYFSFFKAYTKAKKTESKMLAGLLTGVNRAFPFAKVDSKVLEEELNTLYKTVHTVNFNTAVQALMLLHHTMEGSTSLTDRFYQALYRKLLDPCLGTSTKQAMFLNILYKSLKKDESDARTKGFIKRLLQICSHMKSNFACGSLMLVSEILHGKPHLLDIPKIAKDLDLESDDELEHFDDVREETDDETQMSRDTESEPEADVNHEQEVQKVLGEKGKTTVKASWVHLKSKQGKGSSSYDMQYRNPMYSNADKECVWELKKLEKHYHPTVTLFAQNLLKGERIKYSGDPLLDFTLMKFLDRFVYKNPKKSVKEKSTHARKPLQTKGVQQVAVNTDAYLKMDEKNIPVDEKFYYRYFNEEAKRKGIKETEDFDEEASDVTDDEFDDFLTKYEGQVDGKDATFDFDFASEFTKQKKLKKGKKDEEEDDDSDFDLDEFENLSDEEMDFSDDEDLKKAFENEDDFEELDSDNGGLLDGEEDDGEWESGESGADDVSDDADVGQQVGEDDFDEDEIAFSDDDLGDDLTLGDFSKSASKPSAAKHSNKRKSKDKTTLAKKKRTRGDGQLFAAAEEFSSMMDGSTGEKFSVGTEALSNKDNAHVKQLRWEADQDRWLKDKDWKSRKQAKAKALRGRSKAFSKGKKGKKFKGIKKRR